MDYNGEIHRLIELKPNFSNPKNLKQFNDFYQRTQHLRLRLAFQIDHRRLGVTKDIILSWFDDKFIFVYNKYYEIEPERLLGYIINSLRLYKNRILKKAYQGNVYQNMVELEGESKIINTIANPEPEEDIRLEQAKNFLKTKLSEDAFFILTLELNPPPFIMWRIKNPNQRIPSRVITEYIDLGYSKNAINYVIQLRKEIQEAIIIAKKYFTLETS